MDNGILSVNCTPGDVELEEGRNPPGRIVLSCAPFEVTMQDYSTQTYRWTEDECTMTQIPALQLTYVRVLPWQAALERGKALAAMGEHESTCST